MEFEEAAKMQCDLGKNVYVDFDVPIGNRVKIQNNLSIRLETIIDRKRR